MTNIQPFTYRAKARDIVDGDTITVTVDLGFKLRRSIDLRLRGVDTAEIHFVSQESEEYRRGQRHKEFVEEWLPDNGAEEWPLRVRTHKTGKYGRYLAEVVRAADGAVLNDDLLDEFGDAVRYE